MKVHGMLIIGLALLAAAGCNGTVGTERAATERHVHQRPDPVLDMLHRQVHSAMNNALRDTRQDRLTS